MLIPGIFINDSHTPFTDYILRGWKTAETRSRDMLRLLVGKRIAIVRTGIGRATIVGYATISEKEWVSAEEFPNRQNQTCVIPGSRFDCKGKGKWLYHLTDVESVGPYPLPKNAIRHGMSWCEFNPYENEED